MSTHGHTASMKLDIPLMRAAASIVAHCGAYPMGGHRPVLRSTAVSALERRCAPAGPLDADQLSDEHMGAILGYQPVDGWTSRHVAQAILASEGGVTHWWAETLGARS